LLQTYRTIIIYIQTDPNKMLKRSVKAISRSPAYLERVAVGQHRFDIEGNASGEVTEHEYQYIRARRFAEKKAPC